MRVKKEAKRTLGALGLGALCLMLGGCVPRSSGGSLSKQGYAALEKEDYHTALADFQQAIANGEDAVMAYRGEGISMMGIARYGDAINCFEQALTATDSRMPQTVADIRKYLASAQYRDGRYADAVATCQTLLTEDEAKLPEVYYYLGASYVALGDQLQAREQFDQAVALDREDYLMYLHIYEVYEDANLTAVGDEYLQTALQIVPQGTQAAYRTGQIYYYLEKYDEARAALLEPVEERYIPALELMGEIYLSQEDYPHALAAWNTILEESGDLPEVYNGLALCALASGDYDEALRNIEQGLALETDEGKQQLRFNEIVAYEKKLDFATAQVKAEAYVALYPTDSAGQKELKFLRTRVN